MCIGIKQETGVSLTWFIHGPQNCQQLDLMSTTLIKIVNNLITHIIARLHCTVPFCARSPASIDFVNTFL